MVCKLNSTSHVYINLYELDRNDRPNKGRDCKEARVSPATENYLKDVNNFVEFKNRVQSPVEPSIIPVELEINVAGEIKVTDEFASETRLR